MTHFCNMLNDREIGRRVRVLLEEYLGVSVHEAERPDSAGRSGRRAADFIMRAGEHRFVIQTKAAGGIEPVASAVRQLAAFADDSRPAVRLVVVPFMSENGRAYAAAHGISWLDLSGNASIVGQGLRVLVDGKPNQFVRPGRPRDLFAPRSARVTRALLLEPFTPKTQTELAHSTGLNRGTVSRVVAALLDTGFVERIPSAAGEAPSVIRVVDPNLLLDAWRRAVDFSANSTHRFAVAARTGEALARRAAQVLTQAKVDPAATGLVAAWCYAGFRGFQTVSFYVRELPAADQLRSELGGHEDPLRGNLWLVLPKDGAVRMGSSLVNRIPCVSAVQAHVDMAGHTERASEAAEAIMDRVLRWPRTGRRESGIPRSSDAAREPRDV